MGMTIALDGEPGAWDVASFDFLHPQMRVDPFPTFSIMREQAPVQGGAWHPPGLPHVSGAVRAWLRLLPEGSGWAAEVHRNRG